MNKYVIAAVLASIILAFATGRYSVKQTNLSTTSKTEDVKHEQTDTKSHVVVVKQPNGTTTTTTDTTTTTHKDENTKQTEQAKTSTAARKSFNISLLGGYDLSSPRPVAGVVISKEIIGPVTAGFWGTNQGAFGVSVGVNF
jgi:hypothetical protein